MPLPSGHDLIAVPIAVFEPPAPAAWPHLEGRSLALALGLLLLAGLLAALRRSIARSVAERLRAQAGSAAEGQSVEALLGRLDRVAVSVQLLELAAGLGWVLGLAHALADGAALGGRTVALALLLGAPALWFFTDALARALALRRGDSLLLGIAPVVHALHWPLVGLGWLFERVRTVLLRVLRIEDDTEKTREIVAGLREVIASASISGQLDETEREIIGNVMEFRDGDVAALMTPRTEIQAAEVEDGVLAAARVLASSGHSRIPVYEDSLDRIIGTISARDIVQLLAAGKSQEASLRQIAHPAYFVPETKHVHELLGEMRREKLKIAIVLDEYGGTAGLITMGDLLGELVGELPDEYDADEPSPVRRLAGGAVEVDASLHVSEVNETLDLDLPEEADFETLGGFVLAELGHFPEQGERFRRNGHEFVVAEASDRRVLKVRVEDVRAAAAS